jgi:hypothetical protein
VNRVAPVLAALAVWGGHFTALQAWLWLGCTAWSDATLHGGVVLGGVLAGLALGALAWRLRRARLASALALAGVAWATAAALALPACEIVH